MKVLQYCRDCGHSYYWYGNESEVIVAVCIINKEQFNQDGLCDCECFVEK